MPEISRFFGIIITINFFDHAPPHFHARYGDQTVSIAILDLAILQGNMRPRALALVMEWAALHQTAILVDWERAANGEPVLPIPPLA